MGRRSEVRVMRPAAGVQSRSGGTAGWLFVIAIVVAVRLPHLSREPLTAVDGVLFTVVIAFTAALEVARRHRARADRATRFDQTAAADQNATVRLASRRESRSTPVEIAHRRSA